MANKEILELIPGLKDCALAILVGEKLGSGAYREVYACAFNPKLVLKLEVGSKDFSNVNEWKTWIEVHDTKWAQWFAPCHAIDEYGGALLQERTKPLTAFPKGFKVPAFFADLKPENFGRLNGRIVCHDYANNLLYERGLSNVKMKEVK